MESAEDGKTYLERMEDNLSKIMPACRNREIISRYWRWTMKKLLSAIFCAFFLSWPPRPLMQTPPFLLERVSYSEMLAIEEHSPVVVGRECLTFDFSEDYEYGNHYAPIARVTADYECQTRRTTRCRFKWRFRCCQPGGPFHARHRLSSDGNPVPLRSTSTQMRQYAGRFRRGFFLWKHRHYYKRGTDFPALI